MIQAPGVDHNGLAALWVDTLLEMIRVPAGELEAAPISVGGVEGRFLQAVLERGEERIYIIKTEEIVREKFSDEKQFNKVASR